ncbi:hypothetical protein D3C74_388890 [compost metagenome]
MVIAHLAVIHNPLGDRQRLTQQWSCQYRIRPNSYTVQPFFERACHIRRQIPAVRTRISHQLMLFIQPLKHT